MNDMKLFLVHAEHRPNNFQKCAGWKFSKLSIISFVWHTDFEGEGFGEPASLFMNWLMIGLVRTIKTSLNKYHVPDLVKDY